MKTDYKLIRSLFLQRAMSTALIEQTMKDKINTGTMIVSNLDFWCWRYVFMKDVSKKCLTNKLLKLGYPNLDVVEIIDGLNRTRVLVKDLEEKLKGGAS